MRYTLLFFALVSAFYLNAQLKISQTNTNYCIDFDHTIDGINVDTFSGTGFQRTPISGQLNSNGLLVTGLSNGDMSIDSTKAYTEDDYARGYSSGGITTGGIYAFEVAANDVALGFQATGSDMTAGEIICICNNATGATINKFEVSYDFLYYNDQERSSDFVFSYSSDNYSYTTIDTTLTSTPTESDTSPSWISTNISTSFTIDLPSNDSLFLKWTTDDSEGSGSRDEMALDNIYIKALDTNTTSITKNKEAKVSVYPNPFDNFINIQSEEKIASVQLYNSLGQCIFNKIQIMQNKVIIDTENFKSGVYILNTKLNSGRTIVQKTMKY